jgi:hypothetical protein
MHCTYEFGWVRCRSHKNDGSHFKSACIHIRRCSFRKSRPAQTTQRIFICCPWRALLCRRRSHASFAECQKRKSVSTIARLRFIRVAAPVAVRLARQNTVLWTHFPRTCRHFWGPMPTATFPVECIIAHSAPSTI